MSAKRLTKKQAQKKRLEKEQEQSRARKLRNTIDSLSRPKRTEEPTLAETLLITTPTPKQDSINTKGYEWRSQSTDCKMPLTETSLSDNTSRHVTMKGASSAMPCSTLPSLQYRESSHTKYPSAQMTPQRTLKRKKLSAIMMAREKKAQEEIERKKLRVAVLVNKSGYQYITDDTDLTTLGRKV